MPEQTKYVVLDGTAHILAGDEHTPCFLLVPFGTEYTTDQPDDLCPECAEKFGVELKPKAKGAKSKA